jgi:hypothetical protein
MKDFLKVGETNIRKSNIKQWSYSPTINKGVNLLNIKTFQDEELVFFDDRVNITEAVRELNLDSGPRPLE